MISTLINSFSLNGKYLTIENYKEQLMEDSIGKLILETRK
jgi:hypothetical protein